MLCPTLWGETRLQGSQSGSLLFVQGEKKKTRQLIALCGNSSTTHDSHIFWSLILIVPKKIKRGDRANCFETESQYCPNLASNSITSEQLIQIKILQLLINSFKVFFYHAFASEILNFATFLFLEEVTICFLLLVKHHLELPPFFFNFSSCRFLWTWPPKMKHVNNSLVIKCLQPPWSASAYVKCEFQFVVRI